jgi:hypothetical protein
MGNFSTNSFPGNRWTDSDVLSDLDSAFQSIDSAIRHAFGFSTNALTAPFDIADDGSIVVQTSIAIGTSNAMIDVVDSIPASAGANEDQKLAHVQAIRNFLDIERIAGTNVDLIVGQFTNNLSAADDTAQKAFDTIDDLDLQNILHYNVANEWVGTITEVGCDVNDYVLVEDQNDSGNKKIVPFQSIVDILVPASHVHDHGTTTGLLDDDHTQYLLASQATDRATFTTNWEDLTDAGDTILHSHTLNTISNPDGNKTFNMTNRQLSFLWTNPAGNPVEFEASGAYAGSLLHIHQHTGNPGSTYLMTLESEDADVEHIESISPSADLHAFCFYVNGDTNPRLTIHSGGTLAWGSGSGAHDTNLYRSAADTLKTDDDFIVGGGDITLGATSLSEAQLGDLTDGGASTLHKHDHGGSDGLGDDDHSLYLLASDATNRSTFATNWTDLTDAGDTILHGHDVTGLTNWAGPYLALTGGNLTDNLYLDKTATPSVFLREAGDTADYTTIWDSSSVGALKKVAGTGAATLRLEAVVSDGTSGATVQLFRTTNTTGARFFRIHKGDGTSTVQHSFNAGSGVVELCNTAGSVTIGEGNLFIDKAADPSIQLREGGTTTTLTKLVDDGWLGKLKKIGTGTVGLWIDAESTGGTGNVSIQLFREANTTGTVKFVVHEGDGTSTANHELSGGSGNADLCKQGGKVICGGVAVQLPYLNTAPSGLTNGMIWMESDGLHIYYSGAEKTVAGV